MRYHVSEQDAILGELATQALAGPHAEEAAVVLHELDGDLEEGAHAVLAKARAARRLRPMAEALDVPLPKEGQA